MINKNLIPSDVIAICDVLVKNGHRGWIVGGCVRDMLMGRTPSDWDIASDATPDRVIALFDHVIPTGIQHGTVTVRLNEANYEVTTLRGDGTYSDGRRPDSVEFVQDIESDLARRDFTMNAIAYDPIDDSIADPFGGVGDIFARRIRAVRDPIERFNEDGLRIMRAARFCSVLEFDLDKTTEAAVTAARHMLAKVSVERIHDELTKIMKSARPSLALNVMHKSGMFETVFKGLPRPLEADMVGTLVIVDDADRDVCRRLATLLVFLVNQNESLALDWLNQTKFSSEVRDRVITMLHHYNTLFEAPFENEGAARRFVKAVGRQYIDDVMWLAGHLRWWSDNGNVIPNVATLKRVIPTAILATRELAINGDDLKKEFGMKPGPEMGRTLNLMLNLVLENPLLNTRENLLTLCKGEKQDDDRT